MTAVYYAVGLWKTGNGHVTLPQLFYFAFFVAFNLSTFVETFTTDDQDNAVFLTAIVLIGALQQYRLYFIIWKQDEYLDLMRRICDTNSNDCGAAFKANRKIEIFMTLVKYFLGAAYTLCVAVACLPLAKKQLLFDVAFPLDYKTDRRVFWMAYLLVAGTYLLSITVMMFVTMVWYMMLILMVKYELLGNEFENLGVEKAKSGSNYQSKGNSYLQWLIEAIRNLEQTNGCEINQRFDRLSE